MRTHKRRFVRVVGFVLLGCVFFASGFIFTQTNVTRGATTTYLLANYDLDKMKLILIKRGLNPLTWEMALYLSMSILRTCNLQLERIVSKAQLCLGIFI